jgi:hypothetical protein
MSVRVELIGGRADGTVMTMPDVLGDVFEWQDVPDPSAAIIEYFRDPSGFLPVPPSAQALLYRWDGTYNHRGERRYLLT